MFSSDKGDPPPGGGEAIKPPTATSDSEVQTEIKPPTATDPETPGSTEATGDTPIVITGG